MVIKETLMYFLLHVNLLCMRACISQLSSVASISFLSGSGYSSDKYSDRDDGSEQTDY